MQWHGCGIISEYTMAALCCCTCAGSWCVAAILRKILLVCSALFTISACQSQSTTSGSYDWLYELKISLWTEYILKKKDIDIPTVCPLNPSVWQVHTCIVWVSPCQLCPMCVETSSCGRGNHQGRFLHTRKSTNLEKLLLALGQTQVTSPAPFSDWTKRPKWALKDIKTFTVLHFLPALNPLFWRPTCFGSTPRT